MFGRAPLPQHALCLEEPFGKATSKFSGQERYRAPAKRGRFSIKRRLFLPQHRL
jgi:hypothetical protein